MGPEFLIGVGFLLLIFIYFVPRLPGRREEAYEDERSYFREQRPRMWGLVGGLTGDDRAGGDPEPVPGRCPDCGTDNEPDFRYCGNCGSLLPTDEE